MKKIIFFVSFLTIASLTTVLSANAQEAGMLPTSPFYFLKEWRMGINKFFTFNPKEILEQKRTELKGKFEVTRERINEVMSKISEKFEDVNRFKQRMETMIENQLRSIKTNSFV